MIWHAGQRGSLAYALAIAFPGDNGDDILSCTAAVIMTLLVLEGMTVVPMLNALGIPYDRDGDGSYDGGEGEYAREPSPLGCVTVSELGLVRLLVGQDAFAARYGAPDHRALARQAAAAAHNQATPVLGQTLARFWAGPQGTGEPSERY